MKFVFALAALISLAIGATSRPEKETIVVIGGDTRGYLSPCGCTKPMTGGIRRRMTVIKMLTAGREAVVLENGGLVASTGRQAEMKLAAMAEALKRHQAVIAVSPEDVQLGEGPLLTAQQLSEGRMIASSIEGSPNFPTSYRSGPFAIGAITPRSDVLSRGIQGTPVSNQAAMAKLTSESEGAPLVILLDGDEAAARALAKEFPAIKLIVYTLHGSPPSEMGREGDTWLATPGERGRYVVRVAWKDGQFDGYSVTKLGPDVADDPDAARSYSTYLSRVDKERLIEKVVRRPGEGAYAGSKACMSCHREAYETWKKSGHAHALDTLEKDGHGHDPECVTCHVVDLERLGAYVSKFGTPDLASVGCESCHGPSGAHVEDPTKKTPRSAKNACITCHNVETSPNFTYDEYWSRIAHK